MAKEPLLLRENRPVTEGRDVRIDQALLVGSPAWGMMGIGRIIENGDAENLVTE